jgi:hypothetical protein
MNTTKNLSRSTRRGAAMLWIMVMLIIGVGGAHRALSLDEGPGPQGPTEPQMRRGFIGLPDAKTLSVQSLLPETANITVTFAYSNGTPAQTSYDSLPAESLKIYPGPADFTGLGRVEMAQAGAQSAPLFGVNTALLAGSGNDAYLGLAWEESSFSQQLGQPLQPLIAFYIAIPYITRGGWNSSFTMQNRSIYVPAMVEVDFYNTDGTLAHPEAYVIPAGGALTVDLTQAQLPYSDWWGSAMISSDQPVAVASVHEFNAELGLSDAYQGVSRSDASTALVAPALFNASDLQTSVLCVQNTGSTDSDVKVSYTDGVTTTRPIPASAPYCFNQGAEGHAPGWMGGALITSMNSQPLVAAVIVTAYNGSPVGRWSYTVPSQGMLKPAVAFPLLNSHHDGWTSKIYLYNSGNSTAVITPRYVGSSSGFVSCAQPISISAQSAISISQADLPAFNEVSMGYFTSTQPAVAAAVGFTSDKPLGTTDRHFGHEAAYADGIGTPQRPCGTVHKVFLPTVIRQ